MTVIIASATGRLVLERETLEILDSWCMTVKVQFAPEKTKMITFSRSRELKTPPKVKFRSCTVCSVNELNYLGAVLDKKLSGLPHLQYVGRKTLAFLNSINGMRLHGSIKKGVVFYSGFTNDKVRL